MKVNPYKLKFRLKVLPTDKYDTVSHKCCLVGVNNYVWGFINIIGGLLLQILYNNKPPK